MDVFKRHGFEQAAEVGEMQARHASGQALLVS
jgi:hypothetical protein